MAEFDGRFAPAQGNFRPSSCRPEPPIRWLPGKTEWLIDDVVVASSTKAQPDANTPVRLNFWAPTSSWTDAYSSSLKPARKASANVRYYYDVEWVEVRQLP